MLPQWYTKLCFITNHQTTKQHVGLLRTIIIIWGIEVEALDDKMYRYSMSASLSEEK